MKTKVAEIADRLTPTTGATIRRLASLGPRTLAVMHGSSYSGAAAPALESLAAVYDELLRQGATGKPEVA
jgi:hypothetical protein